MQTLLSRVQVAVISASCLVALWVTGFFGYDHRGGGLPGAIVALDRVFAQPWPVYVWWCGALLTVQYAMLEPARLKGAGVAYPRWLGREPDNQTDATRELLSARLRCWALGATFWACLLAGLVQFGGVDLAPLRGYLGDFAQYLLRIIRHFRPPSHFFERVVGTSWAATTLNLLLVAWLIGVILRWLAKRGAEGDTVERYRFFIGLFVHGGVLFLALAVLLRFDVASGLVRDLLPAVPISDAALVRMPARFPPFTPCSVSVPGTCPPPHLTWTFVDTCCGLALVAIGLILTGIQLQEAGAHPPVPASVKPPAPYIARLWDMGLEEAGEFLRLLWRALWPSGHHGFVVAVARFFLGTSLIVVAAFAGVEFAREVQAALHHAHDPASPLPDALAQIFALELPMLLWASISLGGIALAMFLLAWRRAFLLDVGGRLIKQVFVLALALWAFGGALLALNQLVLLLLNRAAGVSNDRLAGGDLHPFNPGPLSLLSLSALLIFVGALALGARPNGAADRRTGGNWLWRRFLAWWNKPLKPQK